MQDGWRNKLYFGDNVDIPRRYIEHESLDLIYLDPPFNSNATCNVLLKEESDDDSAARIAAFEDTWQCSQGAEYAYQQITRDSPKKLADLIEAFRMFLSI